MRILWISSHGGNYKQNEVKGTGGWIGALQTVIVKACPDLEIGICFPHCADTAPLKEDNVTYFPYHNAGGSTLYSKLKHRFFANEENEEKAMVGSILQAIDSYKPDVVHVWGVENAYAAVIPHLKDAPVVVHIQGITSACACAYCPPGFSLRDIFKAFSFVDYIKYGGEKGRWLTLQKRAKREIAVSRYVKNWIGRTEWDKTMSQMLSPGSHYFHCDEMMRSDFIGAKWHYHFDGKILNIQSAISEDFFKGMDVVLHTAKILKEQHVNIHWRVYGWRRSSPILKTIISHIGISPESVGVECCGSVPASTIKQGLLLCDCYVHPSYIENSSNAIAEAQLLGVPVIAQYVGGNPTMLKDNSGILVAPNEPYVMAAKILQMKGKSKIGRAHV